MLIWNLYFLHYFPRKYSFMSNGRLRLRAFQKYTRKNARNHATLLDHVSWIWFSTALTSNQVISTLINKKRQIQNKQLINAFYRRFQFKSKQTWDPTLPALIQVTLTKWEKAKGIAIFKNLFPPKVNNFSYSSTNCLLGRRIWKGTEVRILPASRSLSNWLAMIISRTTMAAAVVPALPKNSLNMLDIHFPFTDLSPSNSSAKDFKEL